MIPKIDVKFDEKPICFKNDKNLVKFDHQSTFESLKIWTFIGFFYPKQEMYELKIYRGVMRRDNEELCKI